MSAKIAIAINKDGTSLEHFGHAERFAVYEINAKTAVEQEVRQAAPFCQRNGKQSKLESIVELLRDCKAVVCAAIGPCARSELYYANVEAFEYDGPVTEAVHIISRNGWLP